MLFKNKWESTFLNGCLCVMVYNLILGAQDVFLGYWTQNIPPFFFEFWAFLLTAILFMGITAVSSQKERKVLVLKKSLFALNITTAFSWIFYYFAVQNLEPLLVAVIVCGITPALVVIFGKKIVGRDESLKEEILAGKSIAVIIFGIGLFSLCGHSGLGKQTSLQIFMGYSSSLLSGFFITINTLYSKKLSDAGWSSIQLMSGRFWLLVVIAGLGAFFQGHLIPQNHEEWLLVIGIALIGNSIPLLFLQKGIEKLEPMNLSLLMSIGPIFVIPFQLLDGRLTFSFWSIGALVLTLIFTLYATMAREREESTTRYLESGV